MRRTPGGWLGLALVALTASSAGGCRQRAVASTIAPPAASPFTVNIGYQRSSWAFLALKHDGTLDARLAPLGARVNWLEFTAGPPILEGINVGSVDLALVGDAPPVFAQAGHLRFAYAGAEPAKPEAAAIVVPAESPLQAIGDLKGKRVAVQKGSSAHHLIVESLRAVGLTWGDIEPVYLAPPDARAAFQRGQIDAWAIWDPYYAAAEVQLHARALRGPPTGFAYRQFLVVHPDFPARHAAAYDRLFEAVAEAERRIAADPAGVAAALAADAHVDARILARALARGQFGVQPMDNEAWYEQQRLADLFADLHLVPKIADVRVAALTQPIARRGP
ncbi:MAG TPA: aliphatic sulfonate ABC transporter substrate-binding protein [Polyangia bacterium]|nr:aliphatic sulfonate ABC transporter substrate-binding protein [Polyangia bacterium]